MPENQISGFAMRCPFCGNIDTQVKDSRPAEDHVSIRRRRNCTACGGRFTTYERVQLRDLVVIKTNGRREDFDRGKLERSIRIALQKRPIEHGSVAGSRLDVRARDLGHLDLFEADGKPIAYRMPRHLL